MEHRAFFENRREGFQAVSRSGFSFPPHMHSQLELFLVRSGENGVTVGERQQVLTAGQLVVVFPNQIHSYHQQSPESSVEMIIADLSYTGSHLDALLHSHPARPFLEQPHPDVLYALGALVAEHGQAQPNPAVYGPLVQLVLARAMPQLQLCPNYSTGRQDLIWQIVNYVNTHYREHLTLPMLARAVGVSPGRLSHVFSEKIGQGFPSYLTQIRLSYAQTMLQSTELSITQVGEESGFESQRSFFRVFRQRYGMTPLEYRRQSRRTGGALEVE